MARSWRIASPVVGALVIASALGAAAAPPNPQVDPTVAPLGTVLYTEAHQRGFDQATNPAYQSAAQPYVTAYLQSQPTSGPVFDDVVTDPFRMHWTRGDTLAVSFRNRYNAKLVGHLWSPKKATRRLPAIILVPGGGNAEQQYWGLAQTFAENGYVVLSFDPQGDVDSDRDGTPTSEWCDPNGSWKQPQEGGIAEQGACAGEEGTPPAPPTLLPDVAAPVVGSVPVGTLIYTHDGEFSPDDIATEYPALRPPYTFGALDAVTWLLSSSNPWRSRIDGKRVGVAGHSLGADAAVVAPGVDPLHRFRAAVAFDDYGLPPAGWRPTVPTMIQQSEQQPILGPYTYWPDPHLWVSYRIASALAAAHKPEAVVALRASTHQEWGYTPEQDLNPQNLGLFSASRWGERVGAYFALTWFDRYLKGDARADRRILGTTFDNSVDGSSIGTGTYDAVHQRNQPIMLAGQPLADHLSPLYATTWNFDGHVR